MKTSKSPENSEITPSKKKLKQARLPFKLISDVSPAPPAPQTRKRKLSLPEAEPVTKVGKICKENDIDKDLVVISDDESKDGQSQQKEVKQMNPFVRLVDTARKKKLQKKAPKKKNKSTKKLTNGTTNKKQTAEDDGDVEMVEVDVIINEEEHKILDLPTMDTTSPKNQDQTEKPTENESTDSQSADTVSSVISLEDSNQSSDSKKSSVDSQTEVAKIVKIKKPDNKQKQSETCDSKVKSDESEEKSAEESDDKKEPKSDKMLTPKRSARNKPKTESIPNTSMSKLDESMSSNPSSPKRNTSSVHDESMNDSTVSANLTPKQLQKKLESAKKREEREKEKQEREKKRQQEKDERAKQRQEKEEQRKRERDEKEEVKRREKEEKEEQKRKEREEREKLKEMERKAKELKEELKRKEKEDKEEQKKKEREAKEEEKRKKQEALELEKLEQEQKKKKAAEAFVNFFVPKQKVEKDQVFAPMSMNSALSSFTIKVDMRLAPTTRNYLSDEQKESLEKSLGQQDQNVSYLKSLKDGTSKPLCSKKTWPLSDKDNDDDVMIIEDELPPMDGTGEIISCDQTPREKLRPKLFSFHENRRPPYWGTWRKKSSSVKPRRPFGQDEKQLDYEVDSDDDWEEEAEGESLDGSACGSDEEGDRADDYEVDNELFVPHGYLSDEEATMDEDDVLALSPDAQKAKLKHLEDEFESEMKKPTEKLKPRMYGLLWESKDGGKPDNCVDALWNYFEKFAMIMNDPTPLLQPAPEPEETEKKKANKKKKAAPEGEDQSPKSEKKKKVKTENKESKKPKAEAKKVVPNQPGINSFLTKLKTT